MSCLIIPPPRKIWARVYHSVAQATSSGAVNFLAFDSEYDDTDSIHSTSVNNGRLTAQTAGLYEIEYSLEFAPHATGSRTVLIRLNGSTYIAATGFQADQNVGATINVTGGTSYNLGVGDYVELGTFQNSGGNLNVNRASDYATVFMMTKVG